QDLHPFPTRRSSDLDEFPHERLTEPPEKQKRDGLADKGEIDVHAITSALRVCLTRLKQRPQGRSSTMIKRQSGSERRRTARTCRYQHRSSERRRADRRSGTFCLAASAPVQADVQNLRAACHPAARSR